MKRKTDLTYTENSLKNIAWSPMAMIPDIYSWASSLITPASIFPCSATSLFCHTNFQIFHFNVTESGQCVLCLNYWAASVWTFQVRYGQLGWVLRLLLKNERGFSTRPSKRFEHHQLCQQPMLIYDSVLLNAYFLGCEYFTNIQWVESLLYNFVIFLGTHKLTK